MDPLKSALNALGQLNEPDKSDSDEQPWSPESSIPDYTTLPEGSSDSDQQQRSSKELDLLMSNSTQGASNSIQAERASASTAQVCNSTDDTSEEQEPSVKLGLYVSISTQTSEPWDSDLSNSSYGTSETVQGMRHSGLLDATVFSATAGTSETEMGLRNNNASNSTNGSSDNELNMVSWGLGLELPNSSNGNRDIDQQRLSPVLYYDVNRNPRSSPQIQGEENQQYVSNIFNSAYIKKY